MDKNKKALMFSLFLFACIGVSLGGVWAGYRLSVKPPEKSAQGPSRAAVRTGEGVVSEDDFREGEGAALSAASVPDPVLGLEKIQPGTRMVYQYHYEDDGKIESTEEEAPYFLLDMTKEALQKAFVEWELLSFSPRQVVMRKNVAGKSNQYYILGVQDGYVAVFYAEPLGGGNLKEITDTPVLSLPAEEQRKLREGISVEGYERLLKLLEDYGS